MRGDIRRFALDNAVRYGGEANPNAVIGLLLNKYPNKKKDISIIRAEVESIVKEVNELGLEKQKEEFGKLEKMKLETKEKDLFDMFQIKGRIRTCFPPEPSKYPHIGHAKAILLNYLLSKKYKGSFLVRFDDTNPELAKKEYYKIHLEDYKWLGIDIKKVEYASDNLEKFYQLTERLIKNEQAYVCSCKQKTIKEDRFNRLECKCRKNPVQVNLDLWKKMFKASEGEMIVRLKIDMRHKNTTMRDPAIMRIVYSKHPRLKKKYSVWPTYDLENPVMDGIEKVTHRLRSKEFELRTELHTYIQRLLGFAPTQTYEFARFNLDGVESSGRKIREGIQNKIFIGWDDPRLTTLAALRRRGFLPEAIKEFVVSTGISKAEATLTWDDLIIHNKRLLDPRCDRYFYVEDPKKVVIKNAPKIDVKIQKHPDHIKRGFRNFKTKGIFYISEEDFSNLKDNQIYRLMDCLNFECTNGELIFHSQGYDKELRAKIIHWLPYDKDLIEVKLRRLDSKVYKGLAEKGVNKIKKEEVVQFERIGFCRLDDKKEMLFWFAHR